MTTRTITELYASRCTTEWEETSLLELADAYCDPNNTLDTADLAAQLKAALELPAGALASYVVNAEA